MMDPNTAYFFKKFYRNIIKWWFVIYNPDAKKIWPSKKEEEEARKKEEEELAAIEEAKAKEASPKEASPQEDAQQPIEDEAYNETTGSYSGLYGKGPVDDDTQSMLDQIMSGSSSQNSIDAFLQGSSEQTSKGDKESTSDVVLPPEQDEIIREANAIYERLLREAREDEEKRAAEVEALKKAMEAGT